MRDIVAAVLGRGIVLMIQRLQRILIPRDDRLPLHLHRWGKESVFYREILPQNSEALDRLVAGER